MVAPILFAMVLVGTITDRKAPVAVFSVAGQEESKALGLGDVLDGWTIVQIDPKRVTVQQADKRRTVEIGQTPQAAEVSAAVVTKGNQVIISSDMKAKLSGTDLVRTLMQSCSEPVSKPDGTLTGYKLFEIDNGSIYQAVGFVDGDVVTDIDGRALDSPANAMSALMGVKTKDRFTVGFVRGGVTKKFEVSVQ